MMARFLRFNPPRFDGEPDDRRAEFWLAEVEKIFRVLNYSDPRKVKYATYLFEGAACHWWAVVERRWERDEIEGTWRQFREEFLKKYIPQVVRDLREKEFMRLIQGPLTVAKYEAEFNRLIQYAPHILADEERRRKRFIEGLRPDLRRAVTISRTRDYDTAVETAMELEVEFQELRRIEDKKKEKWSSKSDQEKGKNGSPGKKPKTGNATSSTDKERAPVATKEGNCGFCRGTNHMENHC